jgi:hypothetical protein
MPKRSDRHVFSHAFTGNPFKGKHPVDIYKEIQWGNEPKEIIDIDAPEALINLGDLAKLKFTSGTVNFNKGLYHLAIGADTNYLYIFPYGSTFIPDTNVNGWSTQGYKVKATHYYSEKGGEDCYYYHNHEKPYPLMVSHPVGAHMLIPQKMSDGRRSYAVIKEGIVG